MWAWFYSSKIKYSIYLKGGEIMDVLTFNKVDIKNCKNSYQVSCSKCYFIHDWRKL